MKPASSPKPASIFLFGWVLLARRYWLPAPRTRGVSCVGHASIGARGVGTLLELLGQPYAPTASPTAGYGGWTPHEPC